MGNQEIKRKEDADLNNNLQLPPIPVSVLGLSDVEVINVEIDKYNQFVFTVVSTKREILCHCCGKPTQPYGKGRTIRLRHLPILGRKTYIDITPSVGAVLIVMVIRQQPNKLTGMSARAPRPKLTSKRY
jgi:hypothetical protein